MEMRNAFVFVVYIRARQIAWNVDSLIKFMEHIWLFIAEREWALYDNVRCISRVCFSCCCNETEPDRWTAGATSISVVANSHGVPKLSHGATVWCTSAAVWQRSREKLYHCACTVQSEGAYPRCAMRPVPILAYKFRSRLLTGSWRLSRSFAALTDGLFASDRPRSSNMLDTALSAKVPPTRIQICKIGIRHQHSLTSLPAKLSFSLSLQHRTAVLYSCGAAQRILDTIYVSTWNASNKNQLSKKYLVHLPNG